MARTLADVERRTIKQLMMADLAKSGLVPHARRLAVRALEANEIKALWSGFHEAGAMLIPYWTLDGKPSKFFRVRYLEKLPGAAGAAKNQQRYDQMPVLQEVYYPPLLKKSWREVAKNVEIGVAITEGEKKAACACAHGIPMMALGGVYSFMSSKRSIDLLPSMREFKWKERQVYIVYDNDLVSNPDVLRAQHVLSQRLLSEGAKIRYVSIPQGKSKGVDDYMVAHGASAFVGLIEKAEPFLEGDALWRMNSEVVYVRKIDAVVERDSHTVMDTDRFVRHIYANQHYMAQIERGSGKNKHIVLEKQPLAKRWMEWEHRAETHELAYEPGQPKMIETRHGDAWNMWDGWAVKPKRGPMGPWQALLDFLFKNAPKERKYFEQWCAYPIINPGAKLYTSVVLWSRVKRIGKSMAAMAVAKIYGYEPGTPMNATFVHSRQLRKQFNTWSRNRQLVVGEEIVVGKDQVDADFLKYIITHHTLTVEAKFKDEYDITNHMNMLLLSNHANCVSLEDGDKRYLIHGIDVQRPAPREFYEKINTWLHGDGPSHLMHYFLHDVSMRGFNPREHAPETTSKYEMIQVNKDSIALWVQKLVEDPANALRPLGEKVASGCDLLTAEQLHHAFDPNDRLGARSGGAASLGRHLHNAGFRLVNDATPVGTATGIHRLYAIRNQSRWDQSTRREVKQHYDEFFSPATSGRVK